MIYVSHDAAEVKRIATRVVTLDGGKVAATGGVELLSSDVMPREGGASST
jgi:molybdate transport system ATP-binding protein